LNVFVPTLYGCDNDIWLTDLIIFFWTLSDCNTALCFGSQLYFHLQARKAPTVMDPIDRAILSHWAGVCLNKFSDF